MVDLVGLNVVTSTCNDIQSNVITALLSNCRELDAPSLYVLLLL